MLGTLLGVRAVPAQHQENQNLDDFSGLGTCPRCCDRSRKTLRNSQSHQLKHDSAQRALELDCTGDGVEKPALARRASRISELFFIEPMQALPVEKLPEGDWLYEIKHDGYRALAFMDSKDVRLVSP